MSALNPAAFGRSAAMVWLLLIAALFVFAAQATAATQSANSTFTTQYPTPGGGNGFGLYNYNIAHDDAGNYPFAPGDKRGHCVQETVGAFDGPTTLKTGTDVALNPPPAGVTAADQANRIAWLLLSTLYNQDNAGVSSLTLAQRADAHQSAIWHMTDAGNPDIVSSDPLVAEETARLLAASEANKNAAQQAPAMVATGPATCGGGNRGVAVTGAPFSTAQLTVTGTGTFPGGATTIALDLGPTGAAATTVTGTVGTASISASISQATLVQADFEETQDLVYSESAPVAVQLAIEFPACAVAAATGPTGSVTDAPRLAAPRTRLSVTKQGPARSRAGGQVTFTITVRNTRNVRARNVVITDTLPSGMVLANRASGMTVNGRAVRIRVGSIAPNGTVTRTVTVRVLQSARGKRCNIATANASNANLVRSQACTRVVGIARKIVPAVTG